MGISESGLEVSRASIGDLIDVERLVRAAYSEYIPRIGREPAPMNDDYASLIAEGRLAVARDGAKIVGIIATEPKSDHLHVSNVAVSPCRQGSGLGTILLEHAAAEARKLGLDELRLYTNVKMHENLEFYPRRGFVELGRRVEDGFDRVYFSRKL